MFENIKTIDFVAWYGAIVATGGIVLSFYNILRDRAKVYIKYEPNMLLYGRGARLVYEEGKEYLTIEVVNKGRRPIRIDKAALKIFGVKKYNLLTDSFANHRSRVIDEENPVTTFIVKQDLIDIKKVIYVLIIDGTGKKYKKYIIKFPTIFLIIDWIRNKFKK